MNDRPTAPELTAAVRRFLEAELLPTVSDARLRFQTLVAANVLAIIERELACDDEPLREEWRQLAETLQLQEPVPAGQGALGRAVRQANEKLCETIRRGEFDKPEPFAALAAQLRRTVEQKLAVANPRYLTAFYARRASKA
jgi:hypothetical protein